MKTILAGIAAATVIAAAPVAPATAMPMHNLAAQQADGNVTQVQYRRHYRYRAYGPRYRYRYAAPYPYYGYSPYRRYYAPGPYVGFGLGPFGFGVW